MATFKEIVAYLALGVFGGVCGDRVVSRQQPQQPVQATYQNAPHKDNVPDKETVPEPVQYQIRIYRDFTKTRQRHESISVDDVVIERSDGLFLFRASDPHAEMREADLGLPFNGISIEELRQGINARVRLCDKHQYPTKILQTYSKF